MSEPTAAQAVPTEPVSHKVADATRNLGSMIARGAKAVVETSPADMGRGIAKGTSGLASGHRKRASVRKLRSAAKKLDKLGHESSAMALEQEANLLARSLGVDEN